MIREFRAADIDAVMDIWLNGNLDAHGFIAAQYWTEAASAVREQILEAELHVCEEDGEVLGFAGVQGEYIAGLFVKSEARSRGYGRLLLESVKKRHAALSLNVYRKNARAERFYEREGFQIISEGIDGETGEAYYTMEWKEIRHDIYIDV